MAERRLASPLACRGWLPTWLPTISLVMLTFNLSADCLRLRGQCAGPAAGEGRHRGRGVPVRVAGGRPAPGWQALKLGLEGLYSARRGDYRMIYRIDDRRRRVDVVAIEHRSDIYRPRQL